MSGFAQFPGSDVRARLDHPVIDGDAHVLECEFAINDFLAQVGGPRMVEKSRHATSSSRLSTGWAMALDCTVESTITRSSPIVEAHPAPPRIHQRSTAPVRRVFNDRRTNNSSTTATAKI